MTRKLKPMHPGEVLREEFLVPLKMSAGALAKVCGLPRTRIERIASEQTGITADTALRLGKALGTTAQLWLNLQTDYDVQVAKRHLGRTLTGSRPSTSRRQPDRRSTISQGVEHLQIGAGGGWLNHSATAKQ
jgi:antitoxin HigA-1